MSIGHLTVGSVTTSVITHTANGLIRVPAMMVSVTAAAMIGEIALRVLGGIWSGLFGAPSNAGWLQKISNFVHESGARPFGDLMLNGDFKISTRQLVIKTIAFSALAALSFELASVLCGTPPAIYNHVLTFIGPVRFSNIPYLEGVKSILALWGFI